MGGSMTGGWLAPARAGGALCGAALLLSACFSPKVVMDLAANDELYRDTGYQARLAVDRGAFVAPMVDGRAGVVLEARDGPYPVSWMSEGYWERPLVEMLDEILRRELDDSGVVTRVDDAPPPAEGDVVLRVTLLRARAGTEERVEGRSSLAEIGMRVRVYAPPPAPGARRTVVFDEEVVESAGSGVAIHPTRLPVVLGLATRRAMARILRLIDESNVTRSGVPLDLGDDDAGGAAGGR